MSYSYDTVKSTERIKERSSQRNDTKLNRAEDIRSEVVIGRIKNFKCPACGEVLEEAVTINGEVRGWCGIKHQYVGG